MRSTNIALTANVESTVPWSGTDFDSHGMWTASSPTRLTVGYSGGWLLTAWASSTSAPDAAWYAGRLYKNGSPLRPHVGIVGGTGVTMVAVLVPGDYIEFRVLTTTAGRTLAANNIAMQMVRLFTDP